MQHSTALMGPARPLTSDVWGIGRVALKASSYAASFPDILCLAWYPNGSTSVVVLPQTLLLLAGSDSDDSGSLEVLQRHNITLHEVLGRGMFGKVYKGKAGSPVNKQGHSDAHAGALILLLPAQHPSRARSLRIKSCRPGENLRLAGIRPA